MKFDLKSCRAFGDPKEPLTETAQLFTDHMLSLQECDATHAWVNVILTKMKVGQEALGHFTVEFSHGNTFCVIERVE